FKFYGRHIADRRMQSLVIVDLLDESDQLFWQEKSYTLVWGPRSYILAWLPLPGPRRRVVLNEPSSIDFPKLVINLQGTEVDIEFLDQCSILPDAGNVPTFDGADFSIVSGRKHAGITKFKELTP